MTTAEDHIMAALHMPGTTAAIEKRMAQGILIKYADELAGVIEKSAEGQEGEPAGMYATEHAELIKSYARRGD